MTAAIDAGAGPAVATGLRFAVGPSGPDGATTRSVMAGTAVAVTALVGSLTFGASLARLVGSPPLYAGTPAPSS